MPSGGASSLPESRLARVRWCCSARISVGAIITPWQRLPTAPRRAGGGPGAPPPLPLAPATEDAELDDQQLVESEAPAGLLELVPAIGVVDLAHGAAQGQEPLSLEERLRQWLGEQGDVAVGGPPAAAARG